MKRTRFALLLSFCAGLAGPALAQTITGGTCSASNLDGPYSMVFNGRVIQGTGALSSGTATVSSLFEGVGTATFDGVSKVTFSGTANTNLAAGTPFTWVGTYTLPPNCYGTMTFTQGSSATFTLLVYSSGAQFVFTGTDPSTTAAPFSLVYGGNGGNPAPPACVTATLSGEYTYESTGSTLSGTSQHDVAAESGVLQFDGQGNVTASYTLNASESVAASNTATGTYTVASNCVGTITMTDSAKAGRTINFAIAGAYGENLKIIESTPAFLGSGSAHSAFTNPAQSIANVASYAINATPPGSVFTVFGVNLATKSDQPLTVPLPTTALNTQVTVNGTAVPLFYVSTGQIDAQMPWETAVNAVASVIVKNTGANGSISNAAAVYVPGTGTPGLSFSTPNRAVVVNADGTTNSSSNGAAVGDEVVIYFTGGGPVTASGKLTTGAATPAGLSPLVATSDPTITVGGVQATVPYIGLTPGSVGLYQANFFVPQLAKGTYAVVITISGTASNSLGGALPNPVMTVSN